MIICLCMGLTDEDLAREVIGGCESFDDLIRIKLDDPKKACRDCEEVVKSRMEIRRKISETT